MCPFPNVLDEQSSWMNNDVDELSSSDCISDNGEKDDSSKNEDNERKRNNVVGNLR